MDGLESISKAWKRPIREIVHDEQSQFKQMLHHWHEIYSRPSLVDAEPLRWPGEREPYSISRAPGSKFRMTSEELSAGLQVVDVVLWLFNRSLAGKDLGPRGGHLLNVMFKRGLQTDMSFDGVGKDADRRYQKILKAPISDEQEAGGREMIKNFEHHRLQAMAEHSARKEGGREK
jgi:hypothetical protein